jgi:hypothetical protein
MGTFRLIQQVYSAWDCRTIVLNREFGIRNMDRDALKKRSGLLQMRPNQFTAVFSLPPPDLPMPVKADR